MRTNQQLQHSIALIKKKAKTANQEIIYNFTADGALVIVANKRTGCVGLMAAEKDNSVLFFNVNIGKWSWAKEEGFTTEQIANAELRHEIFSRVTLNKLIGRLTGEQ
jgi:hypothetical protein